jgi:hypothetical protein
MRVHSPSSLISLINSLKRDTVKTHPPFATSTSEVCANALRNYQIPEYSLSYETKPETTGRLRAPTRPMKRTVVWLTNNQVKTLATISKKSLAPVSALVRQAVQQYIQLKRKSPRTGAF